MEPKMVLTGTKIVLQRVISWGKLKNSLNVLDITLFSESNNFTSTWV
jgi:hypothetical protein